MQAGRGNEGTKTWFRSDAVFSCNGHWFFHTREGVDIGPYESQLEAEIESNMLRQLLRKARLEDQARAVLRDFILDSFTLGRPLNVMFSEEADQAIKAELRAAG